jgi:geranylgeranyl reductase family protein
LSNPTYDIIITGAGPAGATAALGLRHTGLRVLLVDKAKFPRHKPCGDAIPGQVFKYLAEFDAQLAEEAWNLPKREIVTGSRIVAHNGRELMIEWVNRAYNASRFDFDLHLLERVKNAGHCEIMEGAMVRQINRRDNGLEIELEGGHTLTSSFVIGADGANSVVARKLTNFTVDRRHLSAAVRQYFHGVTGMRPGITELFFSRQYMPGYFWVFPLADGLVNAGFGMLAQTVVDKSINLNRAFADIITDTDELQRRFANATPAGELKGHNLPFGSRHLPLSGDRFMLCGDAGSLVDPIDGHGIDKAVLSGLLAAKHYWQCHQHNNFSAAHTATYDAAVYARIGTTMQRNYHIMQTMNRHPWLLDSALTIARVSWLRRRLLAAIM